MAYNAWKKSYRYVGMGKKILTQTKSPIPPQSQMVDPLHVWSHIMKFVYSWTKMFYDYRTNE